MLKRICWCGLFFLWSLLCFSQSSADIQKLRQTIKWYDTQLETARREMRSQKINSKEFDNMVSTYKKYRDEALRELEKLEHTKQDVYKTVEMTQQQLQQNAVKAEELDNSFSAQDYMLYAQSGEEPNEKTYQILDLNPQNSAAKRAEMMGLEIVTEKRPDDSQIHISVPQDLKESFEFSNTSSKSNPSSFIVDPEKPFSYKNQQWTDEMRQQVGNVWRPIPTKFNYEDGKVWDRLRENVSEEQLNRLAINLKIMNNDKIPDFVEYDEKGNLVMSDGKGKFFVVSPDGEKFWVKKHKEFDFEEKQKIFDPGAEHDGLTRGSLYAKLSYNMQDEDEWMRVDVGNVSRMIGYKASIGPKVEASVSLNAKAPSFSRDKNFYEYDKYPIDKKWPNDDGETGYELVGVNGKVGAGVSVGEIKGSAGGVGIMKVPWANYYVVAGLQAEASGKVGLEASASAKLKISTRGVEYKAGTSVVAGRGGKVEVAPKLFIYNISKLKNEIPTDPFKDQS